MEQWKVEAERNDRRNVKSGVKETMVNQEVGGKKKVTVRRRTCPWSEKITRPAGPCAPSDAPSGPSPVCSRQQPGVKAYFNDDEKQRVQGGLSL